MSFAIGNKIIADVTNLWFAETYNSNISSGDWARNALIRYLVRISAQISSKQMDKISENANYT